VNGLALAPRRPRRLAIGIPASLVSEVPHLREKTLRIGLVGRAAAIFRVEEIRIYFDGSDARLQKDARLISLILRYMETPQYLRRRLFGLRPELRYAGVLPPLRTPHHPTRAKISQLKLGEYREGVVVSADSRGSWVDIGVEKPALLPEPKVKGEKRITVRVSSIEGTKVLVELASRSRVPHYWGYVVPRPEQSLKELLSSGFDLIVATSRRGRRLADVSEDLVEDWLKSRSILVVFGSPSRGLYEIAQSEGFRLDDYAHYVVNTIPVQGVETVRTEEAIYASLALLNYLVDLHGTPFKKGV